MDNDFEKAKIFKKKFNSLYFPGKDVNNMQSFFGAPVKEK
jgi:hypothetical protein